jgi:hypothetical protein
VGSPELEQSKEPHRGTVPRCGSYSLWNEVAGRDGAIDGIFTSATRCRETAAVMAAAFDVFQRLLITNFNSFLRFWHTSLSFLGCCFVVSTEQTIDASLGRFDQLIFLGQAFFSVQSLGSSLIIIYAKTDVVCPIKVVSAFVVKRE